MIIDSHVHLVTLGMMKAASRRMEKIAPGIMKKAAKSGSGVINRAFIDFLKETGVKDLARMWIAELDANKVDRALFLPISGSGHDDLEEFTSLHPERFSAYMLPEDPSRKKFIKEMRKRAKSGHFVGIKLYPCISQVSVADKSAFAMYEEAGELNLPILVHFGVTHAPVADYRYTNPMDLMLPTRLFPNTNFIIAHFGAGYWREVLMLGFHAKNIYVDTSGTNNWRMLMPSIPELAHVFKRTIEVYTAERVLFGTDTILNGATGYRSHILAEQRKAMEELDLAEETKALIMGGNTQRLFGLK